MGEQWGFYFDPVDCMGCNACAIACKNRHGVEEGHVDWRRVDTVSSGSFDNYQDYGETNISMSCMHCADAPCEKVCPTDAIKKRESDGIVTVDRDACIGCGYCEWACPYGAPQYGEEGLMQKCNLCLDRGPGSGDDATSKNEQDDPLEPACVDECVGGALDAGPIGELVENASEEAAEQFAQNSSSVIVEPSENVEAMGPMDVGSTAADGG